MITIIKVESTLNS